MKNSEFLSRFFERNFPLGKGTLRLVREGLGVGRSRLDIVALDCETGAETGRATFALCLFDEPGWDGGVRSGDPSPQIASLDTRLRETRRESPDAPLFVGARPEVSWLRSHAWALGEYLAERDFPCWIELQEQHPARQVDWCSHLSSCGLACARLVVQLSHAVAPEDVPRLEGSGAWVVRSHVDDPVASIAQV